MYRFVKNVCGECKRSQEEYEDGSKYCSTHYGFFKEQPSKK